MRRLGVRGVALLLLAAGAFIFVVDFLYVSFVEFRSMGWLVPQLAWYDVLSTVVLFLFFGALYALAAPTSVRLLKIHQRVVEESFQKAVAEELAFGPILMTSLIVNFESLTIICLLPLKELVLSSLPVLRPAEPLIPSSVLTGPYPNTFLITVFFATVPGPAIVFCLRYLRKNNPTRGDTLGHALLALCYASLVLAFLSARQGTAISGVSTEWYGRMILLVLLPGNVCGIALMMLLLSSEWVREKLAYVA